MRMNIRHPEFIDLEVEGEEDVYLAQIGGHNADGIYRDIVKGEEKRLAELGFPTEHADVCDMVDSLTAQIKTGDILAYTLRQMYGQDIDAFSVTHGLAVLAPLREKPTEANLGYLIGSHREATNHGYGIATALAIAGYAFENLDLESITVLSAKDKPANEHVAEKLSATIVDGSYVLRPSSANTGSGDNGQTKTA